MLRQLLITSTKTIRCYSRAWTWVQSPELKRVIEEVDRQMMLFEKGFFNFLPMRFSKTIPVEEINRKFRVDVDVKDFEPEDVKVSLKSNQLRIEAKFEGQDKDGSRVQRHLVREYVLPENLDENTLESYLRGNGMLTVEAKCKDKEVIKVDIRKEDDVSKLKNEIKIKE